MSNPMVPAAAEGMPTSSLSQRVNAVFARYVAIEAKQSALPDNVPLAEDEALSLEAGAIRDELLFIRDRSGNADLIGARIMLEMMLIHRWDRLPDTEWNYEEKLIGLPILEALSDAMTGTVRKEARKALASIGVEIGEEVERAPQFFCTAVNPQALKTLTIPHLADLYEGLRVLQGVANGLGCQPRYSRKDQSFFNDAGEQIDLVSDLVAEATEAVVAEMQGRKPADTDETHRRAFMLFAALPEHYSSLPEFAAFVSGEVAAAQGRA